MTDAQVYTGAAIMGAVAGMRSLSAPAIVSQLAPSDSLVPNAWTGLLKHRAAGRTLMWLAAGELIADKLPFIPKRTQTASLILRAISGALSGAAVCSARKRSALGGAVIGMAAAVGATFGAYELRRRAGKRFHIPDWPVAIVEDAIAAGSGALVLSSLRTNRATRS